MANCVDPDQTAPIGQMANQNNVYNDFLSCLLIVKSVFDRCLPSVKRQSGNEKSQ